MILTDAVQNTRKVVLKLTCLVYKMFSFQKLTLRLFAIFAWKIIQIITIINWLKSTSLLSCEGTPNKTNPTPQWNKLL